MASWNRQRDVSVATDQQEDRQAILSALELADLAEHYAIQGQLDQAALIMAVSTMILPLEALDGLDGVYWRDWLAGKADLLRILQEGENDSTGYPTIS